MMPLPLNLSTRNRIPNYSNKLMFRDSKLPAVLQKGKINFLYRPLLNCKNSRDSRIPVPLQGTLPLNSKDPTHGVIIFS